MGIGDRHQKKDVEAALKRAEARGLKVKHDKNRHHWGYVICCPCNDSVTVYCPPRDVGTAARRIDEFSHKHHGCT
ncbi:hypothetical protein [Streptomyces sp. NPDC020965]|uniref:hypothetical protein n=1 Tax=Streptomyces sp. NPDC020965 TaxID=3365105 RepID=UPI0037A71B1D